MKHIFKIICLRLNLLIYYMVAEISSSIGTSCHREAQHCGIERVTQIKIKETLKEINKHKIVIMFTI